MTDATAIETVLGRAIHVESPAKLSQLTRIQSWIPSLRRHRDNRERGAARRSAAHIAANKVPLAREKKRDNKKKGKKEKKKRSSRKQNIPHISAGIFLSVIYKNALNITLRSVQQ